MLKDVNGDGVQDDSAYVVLARHVATKKNALEIRRVSNGEKLKRLFLDNWWVFRALTVAGVSGGTSAGLGVMAQNPADGKLRLQVKDSASGAVDRNYSPRLVFINYKRLTERDLTTLEEQYGITLITGNFWYDERSGLWGFKGGPGLGFIAPNLDLGGRRLPEDASYGNTGVFFNGRELHQLEFAFLQQVYGSSPRGATTWTLTGAAASKAASRCLTSGLPMVAKTPT